MNKAISPGTSPDRPVADAAARGVSPGATIIKTLRCPDFRFVLLKPKDKAPFEQNWQNNGYRYDDERLLTHIKNGGNFGIIGGYGDLRLIDCDNKDFAAEMEKKLQTFTVKTGSGGKHLYILSDYETNHVFVDGRGEYRAKNYQCVCPGCIHPNGNKYEVARDLPIKRLSKDEVLNLIKPYLRSETPEQSKPQNKDTSRSGREFGKVCQLIKRGLSKEEVFAVMTTSPKWQNAPEQYREKTFEKALSKIKEEVVELEPITDDLIEILEDPDILENIDKEIDKKVVGESEARKVIFLVANMRNVENLNPGSDNLIVNAISGTGKDHVTAAVFDLIPKHEKEELVRTTPKVLTYTKNQMFEPEATWKKTALRLEDVSRSVIGDDAFKVFSSANPNKLNRGKTMIKQKVVEIHIDGKPSMVLTIANPDIKDEGLRRFPMLFLDEGRDQTKEILKRQALYAAKGISIEYDNELTKALQYLERVKVSIPYAEKLIPIFNESDKNVIARTVFPRFLDYIRSSASLHQYQRGRDSEGNIIANKQDYELGALCLKKTISNVLLVPLSKLDQAIYDFFEKNPISSFTVDELMNQHQIQKLGKKERWIRHRLDFLVSKGFLDRESETYEGSFKPVIKYSFVKLSELIIPTAEELNINANTTITTNTTFNANSTNTANRGGI